MSTRSLLVGLTVGLLAVLTACSASRPTAVVRDERVMVLPADVVLPALEPTSTATPVPPTPIPPTPTPEPVPTPAPTVDAFSPDTPCLDRGLGATGRPECTVPVLIAGPAITQASFFDSPGGAGVNIIFDYLDGRTVAYPVANPTQFGNALTLAVVSGSPGDPWAEVQIPTRPTIRAWVKTQGFTWLESDGYIQVDLATSQLSAWAGDELVVDGAFVQTGDEDSPTPLGTTYVDEVITGDAVPVSFGTVIVSLAVFSEVLPRFGNGLPKLSINGTGLEILPAGPVSQGSVTAENAVLDVLLAQLGPGARVDVIDSSGAAD